MPHPYSLYAPSLIPSWTGGSNLSATSAIKGPQGHSHECLTWSSRSLMQLLLLQNWYCKWFQNHLFYFWAACPCPPLMKTSGPMPAAPTLQDLASIGRKVKSRRLEKLNWKDLWNQCATTGSKALFTILKQACCETLKRINTESQQYLPADFCWHRLRETLNKLCNMTLICFGKRIDKCFLSYRLWRKSYWLQI